MIDDFSQFTLSVIKFYSQHFDRSMSNTRATRLNFFGIFKSILIILKSTIESGQTTRDFSSTAHTIINIQSRKCYRSKWNESTTRQDFSRIFKCHLLFQTDYWKRRNVVCDAITFVIENSQVRNVKSMSDQTIHPPPQIISNDLLKEAKKERKKFLGRSRFPMAAECLRFFCSVPFFLFCIHTYIYICIYIYVCT